MTSFSQQCFITYAKAKWFFLSSLIPRIAVTILLDQYRIFYLREAGRQTQQLLFCHLVSKEISITSGTNEQILLYADGINALTRKQLGYRSPGKPFDEQLDIMSMLSDYR